MSLTPFFYLIHTNPDTGKSQRVAPYIHRDNDSKELVPAELWWYNGTHNVFAMLGTNTRDDSFDPISGIHAGIPYDCAPVIEEIFKVDEDDDFKEYPWHWISLSDLYIETIEHPSVENPDCLEYSDESPYIDNPLIGVYNRAMKFVDIWFDGWDINERRSECKLVYCCV